jgi:hypothetical protein
MGSHGPAGLLRCVLRKSHRRRHRMHQPMESSHQYPAVLRRFINIEHAETPGAESGPPFYPRPDVEVGSSMSNSPTFSSPNALHNL